MKQIILFLYMLGIIATISITMNAGDDTVEKIASSLSMSREEVEVCFNKTNAKIADLMQLDRITDDDVHTIDFDESALKAGCLIACLLQTKGLMSASRINMDKIKDLLNSRMNKYDNPHFIEFNRILNICSERIKSKTNECEVSLVLILCAQEEHRLQRNTI